ncbi:hypothetical protein K443DRAFT_110285, partial [Laccaria amethystina LaAM-08-1]
HSHGLKWMFMYKQGRKVKFRVWSMIMHTAGSNSNYLRTRRLLRYFDEIFRQSHLPR